MEGPGTIAREQRMLLLEQLTPREREVFSLLIRGQPLKQAAAQLGVQYCTVNSHTTRIYRKLQVRTRSQLILRYGSCLKEEER